MNSIFHPDDQPNYQDSGQNPSGQVAEDFTQINMEIQFTHFILISLFIVLPPFIHVLRECRASRYDVCSKFIISVTSGCFISFLMGTKALTLTFLSDGIMNICLSYITVDNIVLAWLILSASLYSMKVFRSTTWLYSTTQLILWVWFVVAVVMHLVTYVITKSRIQCFSSPIRVSDSVSIYMPLVRSEHSSTSLTVLSAVIYLPPVIVILMSGLRMRHQKGKQSDKETDSLDMMASPNCSCLACARTLILLHNCWWRSFLCMFLGVFRPCWILGNWFYYSVHKDFPPIVGIVFLFYPLCVAQTINMLQALYLTEPSIVFHV